MVYKALKREEVIGKSIQQQVFELVDAIWLNDIRIKDIKPTGK